MERHVRLSNYCGDDLLPESWVRDAERSGLVHAWQRPNREVDLVGIESSQPGAQKPEAALGHCGSVIGHPAQDRAQQSEPGVQTRRPVLLQSGEECVDVDFRKADGRYSV